MDEKRLTPRQQRFAEAYAAAGDPEAAARAAGYGPKHAAAAGRKLLQNPAVETAIRKLWRTGPKPYPLSEQTVIGELCAIAFSDYTDYVRVEDGEVRVTDSSSLDYSRRAAIAGIKDTGKGIEIKLHDKQKALELLAKYLGLWDKKDAEDSTLRVVFDAEAEEWAE